MRGPDVLDVGRYPRAVFLIRSITPVQGQAAVAPGQYELTGQFTLHGITRPLQFRATLQPSPRQGALRLTGSFAILQTAYGIQPYSALAGLARVADQLQIWGDLTLTPAAP
jgi:polyisoprenoid-binding protein YceI